MRTTTSTFNPLQEVLELFSSDNSSKFLTVDMLEKVRNLLDLGGVHCETHREVMSCLLIMRDQKLLEIEEWYKNVPQGREFSFVIKRKV